MTKKEEKEIKNKGITLIALVITIIVLLILAGVTILMLVGDNGIIAKSENAKVETEIANEKQIIELSVMEAKTNDIKNDVTEKTIMDPIFEKNIGVGKYSSEKDIDGLIVTYTNTKRSYLIQNDGTVVMYEEKQPIEIPESNGKVFSRDNGIIDIQFLVGTSYNVGKANAPKIDKDNMIPVNWNGENWVVTDEKNWDYDYGDTSTTRKWANVMLRDSLELENINNSSLQNMSIDELKGKVVKSEGSMFVWIPRYAYKITYYSDSQKLEGTEIGYSDARGLVDKEGKTPEGMNAPVTSVAVGDNYYRPHPAFENNSSTNSEREYSQGEWSKKIEGIWIGKFETTSKLNEKITVKPNVAAYVNQTIGTAYTDAIDLQIDNSHLIKNSEWGAMAYLTESKYGRNGEEVSKNMSHTTGDGNYKENINQSTTNNVYGIYDTSSGVYERVSAYIANSLSNVGNSFASTNDDMNNKTESTRYATVYETEETDVGANNYNANINKVFGDAMIETSSRKSVQSHGILQIHRL